MVRKMAFSASRGNLELAQERLERLNKKSSIEGYFEYDGRTLDSRFDFVQSDSKSFFGADVDSEDRRGTEYTRGTLKSNSPIAKVS